MYLKSQILLTPVLDYFLASTFTYTTFQFSEYVAQNLKKLSIHALNNNLYIKLKKKKQCDMFIYFMILHFEYNENNLQWSCLPTFFTLPHQ